MESIIISTLYLLLALLPIIHYLNIKLEYHYNYCNIFIKQYNFRCLTLESNVSSDHI